MDNQSAWVRALAIFAVPLLLLLAASGATGSSFSVETKLGSSRDLTVLRTTLPLESNDTSMLFLDLRAMTSTEPSIEGNIGLAYRNLEPDQNLVVGGYAFYDRRRSPSGHVWDQVTLGFETLGPLTDFRVNGYFPRQAGQLVATTPADAIVVSGTDLLYEEANINTFERAMTGFDFEVGRSVGTATRTHVGGYVFHAQDLPVLAGVRLGVQGTTDLGTKGLSLTTKLEGQHDTVRGTQGYVGFELTLPLGHGTTPPTEPPPTSDLARRMNEPIRRDIDIVTLAAEPLRQVTSRTAPLHPVTHAAVKKVWFVTQGGAGDGSVDRPANIDFVKAHAGEHDLIVIRGDDGPVDTGTDGYVMKPGQIIASPGIPLPFVSTTGRTAEISFAGSAGQLTNTLADQVILTLANSSSVLGLGFGGEGAAIYGESVSGIIRLRGNTITAVAGRGIDIVADGTMAAPLHLVIEDNVLADIGGEGISLVVSPAGKVASVEIARNHISGTDGSAISASARGSAIQSLLVANNTIDTVAEHGLHLHADLVTYIESLAIVDNAFSGTDGNGIALDLSRGSRIDGLIARNILSETGWDGIQVVADSSSIAVTIANNSLENIGNDGVTIETWGSSGDITTERNVLATVTGIGIQIDARSSNLMARVVDNVIDGVNTGIRATAAEQATLDLTVRGNHVASTKWESISISARDALLSAGLAQNTLSASGNSGIYIWASTHSTVTVDVLHNTISRTAWDGITLNANSSDVTANLSGNDLNAIDDTAISIRAAGGSDVAVKITDNSLDGLPLDEPSDVALDADLASTITQL